VGLREHRVSLRGAVALRPVNGGLKLGNDGLDFLQTAPVEAAPADGIRLPARRNGGQAGDVGGLEGLERGQRKPVERAGYAIPALG